LGQLAGKMAQLDSSREWLVVCHHGIRSAHACYYLERNGFQVVNLTGGIDRWAKEVDRDMLLY
jgi:rhodanese-related sulfurtransferase